MISMNTPLSHNLFDFMIAELIRNIIVNNLEDDVGRKVATRKVDSHNAKSNDYREEYNSALQFATKQSKNTFTE